MGERRCDGAAAQHHLARHEFAVVLAQGAGQSGIAWVAEVGAAGPLPNTTEEVRITALRRREWMQTAAFKKVLRTRPLALLRGHFPLALVGQAHAGPARKGLGLKVADVADRGGQQVGKGADLRAG